MLHSEITENHHLTHLKSAPFTPQHMNVLKIKSQGHKKHQIVGLDKSKHDYPFFI